MLTYDKLTAHGSSRVDWMEPTLRPASTFPPSHASFQDPKLFLTRNGWTVLMAKKVEAHAELQAHYARGAWRTGRRRMARHSEFR